MSVSRLFRILRSTALQVIPTVIGILILDFFLLRLAPGDAADVMAGESGSATVETMAMMRHSFGLDLPVLRQLFAYLSNLAHGSLGFSPLYNLPVATLIGQRLPDTLLLMGLALGILPTESWSCISAASWKRPVAPIFGVTPCTPIRVP